MAFKVWLGPILFIKMLLKTAQLLSKHFQKLYALARIANYMDLPKRKVLMKVFITSQFSYCPLLWMSHSRTLNNRINNIRERALRLTYKDNQSSFKRAFRKRSFCDSSSQKPISFSHRNL